MNKLLFIFILLNREFHSALPVSPKANPGSDEQIRLVESIKISMLSWIYNLRKDDLVSYLEHLAIPTEGNLDDLRRRLRDYVLAHPGEAQPPSLPMPQLDEAAAPAPRGNLLGLPSNAAIDDDRISFRSIPEPTPMADSHMTNSGKVMNQIRKWGCHFDGKDPLAFLERIEELRSSYQFTETQLLLGLPELLRGDSLAWYRNQRDDWESWEDFSQAFRQRFLPSQYQERLRREIYERRQKPGESYAKYSDALVTLMRRAGGYSRREKLDLVYQKLSAKYRLYIRRAEVSSLGDLNEQAAEYEQLLEEEREEQKKPKPKASLAAVAYDPNECCWRSKQRGHMRRDCQRPAKKFCSRCGKEGVWTRDCHPPPGNARRTEAVAAVARSEEI